VRSGWKDKDVMLRHGEAGEAGEARTGALMHGKAMSGKAGGARFVCTGSNMDRLTRFVMACPGPIRPEC
jgi:hypothetical protein